MKLTRISIDNFLGVRSVDVKLTTPITLFAGANGASKSSIREAVAMAMTGEVVRVSLKKEYGALVADGAKQGGAMISAGDLGYAFNVPAGAFKADDGLPTGEAVSIALNGQHFTTMPADERRTFLFGLTGCKISRDDVKVRMLARRCDTAKVEAVLPMLRTGFPDACEFAKKKATEAKGAWRAVTGGTYGSKVADGWKAEKPAAPAGDMAASKAALVALETEIATLNQSQGELNAAAKARAENVAKRLTLQSAAESYSRTNENLGRAKIELAEYEPKVTTMRERAKGGGRAGLIHDMGRFIKMDIVESRSEKERLDLVNRYEAEHGKIDPTATPDLDAQSSLPEHERGLEVLRNKVTNLQRDLNNAQIARVAFDALAPADATGGTAGDLAALQARLLALKASRDKMQADVRATEDVLRTIAQADEKTKKAGEHHADVGAWGIVADALAPDGIPDELLAEALAPVNARLAASATETKWAVPRIESDMQITAGNRSYALLSESEKWRVDAMIAESVAFISGLKILMLDRVDVLDLTGRSTLLRWLDVLAQDGEIDTALLFATLKALPSVLLETMTAHWVAGGTIQQFRAAA